MKTIVLAAIVLIATASCKKEYTCQCTKTYTGNTTTLTVEDGKYIYKDSKPRAIDKCNSNESTGSDMSGDYARNCEIK